MKKDDSELKQQVALFRYGLISDIVCLDPGTKGIYAKIKEKAARNYTIPGSRRGRIEAETFRDWIKKYRKDGFDALFPKTRTDKGQSRTLTTEIEDILIDIKEENLQFSVKHVIDKAKEFGKIDKNLELSQTSVYRLLSSRGLMDKRKIEEPGGKDHRRFSYDHAGELFMSDVMHGPSVFTSGRKKHKAYLIAFIDDASRVIPYAEFALGEKTKDFMPVFKQAVMQRGIPKRLFVDNGSAFRSRHLAIVCARLGITLIHSKAYHAAAKGKIERWFRTIRQQFIPMLNDHHKASLANLNQALWAYVEGEYHHNIHRMLGESPLDRWAGCAGRVRYPDPGLDLEEVFLLEDKRKVHKDRTISLHGKVYEADAALVGETVILRYDPASLGQPIQVWFKNNRYDDAKLVDTLANCYVKRERPAETLSIKDDPGSNAPIKIKASKTSMNFSEFNNS